MKKHFVAGLLGLGLILGYQSSFAIGDAAVVAQLVVNLKEMVQQYNKLQDQYQTMQQQYQSLQAIQQNGVGNYGWGNWDNSNAATTAREWAPSNWHSALQGLSGGNPARYQQLLAEYKQNHATMSAQNYAKGADANLSKSYKNQVQTNQASSTAATYAFDQINAHLKTLHQLGQQIENAQKNHNLKAAMDLNSRIELEVGFISISELRMQALLNQQTSQLQASKIADENEASQYNQAGENP